MPKLVDSLSGKHALGRKSRMCLDILLVWWLESKGQSIRSHRGLFKEIKHVTHGFSASNTAMKKHKTIQEILMEEPLV